MAISFEEFRRKVPKRTMDFLITILPFVDSYRRRGKNLDYVGSDVSNRPSNEYSTNFFLVLSFLADYPEIEAEFNSLGFDKYRIKRLLREPTDISVHTIEELYISNSNIIPNYLDSASYYNLTPIDIMKHLYNNYNKNCSNTVFFNLFKKTDSTTPFANLLNEYNKKFHEEDTREIIKECFEGLDVSVINYLETAIKIRHLLVVEDILPGNFSKNEYDLVPLSLFLATYFYNDPRKDENGLNDKKIIINYLDRKGINVDKVRDKLKNRLNSSDMEKEYKNIRLLRYYYLKYCYEGANIDNPLSKVKVQDILTNVFNRKYTKSLSVETLFSMLGCHISDFKDFNTKINDHYIDYNRELISGKLNDFYKDLNKDVKDYMQFAAKTYKLIMNKMKEGKHNKQILKCEDDADTLALLIASYYFNCNVAVFYKSYGITLDKVFDMIGIKLTKEEINSTNLDERILVNKYNRFVREGNNSNLSKSSITINDIALNLCSREFNKSTIMEDLFNSLTDKNDIDGYFKDRLKRELEVLEEKRKNRLYDKLFKDIPVETVKYFEDVSTFHTEVKNKLPSLNDEDVKTLSLLLAIANSKTIYGDMFRSIGITENNLFAFFEKTLYEKEKNIDVINENYCNYIFGGYNKNKERKDITLNSILHNILNKDFNNSTTINRFLSTINLSYKDFENIDELLLKCRTKIEEDERIEYYKKTINNYRSSLNQSVKMALKTYKYIKDNYESIAKKGLISSENDILEASMLIGLDYLDSSNVSGFFVKYGLYPDRLRKVIGLAKDAIDVINASEVDYRYFPKFEMYLGKNGNSSLEVNELSNLLFDNTINDSLVIEKICANNNIDYNIIKKEIETGVDYEDSLTVKDRIAILNNEELDVLDVDDISSILHFGNSLLPHTKYIYSELPRLAESDSHAKSVESIQDITTRVYDKQDSKGIFARLFKVDRNARSKVTINKEALEDLRVEIDRNISVLSGELLAYDQIRRYMEAYRKRNAELYKVASSKDQELTEEMDTLDPHNEEEFDRFLQVRSLHQIMRDKTNRFLTTNRIAQQDIIRINDSITNHFITINALEMAKNDLLPLIGSELALASGRASEEQALELSGSVLNLFSSLLTRNISETKSNMELIRNSGLPEDVVEMLSKDVDGYLEDLGEEAKLKARIEPIDIGLPMMDENGRLHPGYSKKKALKNA